MSAIQVIAATLLSVAVPGMKAKALMAAVREQHPEASKKEIVRAAFYALTETGDGNHDAALRLQAFALSERVTSEDDEARAQQPRRKAKRDTPAPEKTGPELKG